MVWHGKLISGGDEVPIKCDVEDLLYADENRIYFIKTSYSDSPLKKEKWSIVSMDHNGNDYKIHYEDEFTDYYHTFSEINRRGYDNGICIGKKIFLKDIERTVEYDIETDTAMEISDFEYRQYEWARKYDEVAITEIETGITRSITLEYLADRNVYAKKILELSDVKNWDNKSLTEHFFRNIKIMNGKIYFLSEVMNFWGEAFAVVFQYDFESEDVKFVSWYFVNNPVSSNYDIVVES